MFTSKQVKDDLPHRVIQTLCSAQSKMFEKMLHKNGDSRPADHIHKTGSLGVKGQRTVRTWASLDQFGQTNLNHSHSNEPMRKYAGWPLNPKSPPLFKVVHNVGAFPLWLTHACRHCCHRELRHRPRPVSGAVVLIQFAPGAVNRAQLGRRAHTFIWEWRVRPTSRKTTTKCAFCVSRWCLRGLPAARSEPSDSDLTAHPLEDIHYSYWGSWWCVLAVRKRQINTTSALI